MRIGERVFTMEMQAREYKPEAQATVFYTFIEYTRLRFGLVLLKADLQQKIQILNLMCASGLQHDWMGAGFRFDHVRPLGRVLFDRRPSVVV